MPESEVPKAQQNVVNTVTGETSSPDPDETRLYSMAGSQFASKVMTALDALKVPYIVENVDFLKIKQLPPPHTVPQMKWRRELLTDSVDILKRVDQDWAEAPFKLYPAAQKKAVEELEEHAGTIINGHEYVLYYTWWVDRGFEATVLKHVTAQYWPLPSFIVMQIMQWTMDIGRVRGSIRKKVRGILGEDLVPQGRDPKPDEEENVQQSLLKRFRDLDARFTSETQQWICNTEHPSAADFSLYCMVERLVGCNGDVDFDIVAPWLWEEAATPKLQAWYERMHAAYPIQFLGKDQESKVWAKA